MKKYYSDFPKINRVENCERYQDEIWIKVVSESGIGFDYRYTESHEWEDYHIPPIVLTNKSSALIYLTYSDYLQSDDYAHHGEDMLERINYDLISISKYNITKILLLRQLSIIYLDEDLFFAINFFLI